MPVENEAMLPEDPNVKPAPDWWKQDGPDRTWTQFVEVDKAKSGAERVASNLGFQLSWLQRALVRLRIDLPVPHPEYPSDVELRDKGLGRLVCKLAAIGPSDFKPLEEVERRAITDALDECGVEGAFGRLVDTAMSQAIARFREQLKTAARSVALDDLTRSVT